MRNRWRVQPQQCGCDSLSIASERGERRPERKLVMRTLFDKLLTLTPIRWQRVLEDGDGDYLEKDGPPHPGRLY